MSFQSGTSKRGPRKHITTACVPCRESKIKCDGATPHCFNCEKKGKNCKYQHGDDKRKVSLRAATELFSARIEQLCQFIYDNGLDPPPMKPEDESAMNRVLDTLQIPRGIAKKRDPPGQAAQLSIPSHSPTYSPPPLPDQHSVPSVENTQESMHPFGFQYSPAGWGFALPTAESLDGLYTDLNSGHLIRPETSLSPDNLRISHDIAQQPGGTFDQTRYEKDDESESGEENEAEKDVIEQISHRIGTLKIAGDGHLRFYGATSNLNLVDVSATQQRQRPDARCVRHDGQDVLNHLQVGQPVEQALEDHLVELYFTWQNSSTYVVDKEMYMTARARWRDELDDTPFYSEVLTNAMCAVGGAFEARYHPNFITFPKSLSEFFADRAKALLEIELDSPCVATVQALAIMSCHEGSSNRDARGWLYSGMSMRLAFDLGLHLDMTPYVEKGDISAFEADVRRIAFWGSYIADHFWGFYLGRPFRMNAGDITVSKPASNILKEDTWHAYGHSVKSNYGLKNPIELISRQFAVLWEIISPLGHILYGCSGISRHDLQRLCHRVTDELFAWKASLPSSLDVDFADDASPKLPHILMLHMQYHQIIIFAHRPWVSKSYIQPRSPRQGPGYHHARRMCIESSISIARLLQAYEKQYTFRRMNNQVVAMIFSAALMLLYATISTTPLSPGVNCESSDSTKMVAYLNVCFRALDELGQSFENAKRTRDCLVSLQRRWQARMRRSGAMKRQINTQITSHKTRSDSPELPSPSSSNPSHKKSRVTPPKSNETAPSQTKPMTPPMAIQPNFPTAFQDETSQHQHQHQQSPSILTQPIGACQPRDLDWIHSSDLHLLSDNLGGTTFPFIGEGGPSNPFGEDPGLPNLFDIGRWWDSPSGNNNGSESMLKDR